VQRDEQRPRALNVSIGHEDVIVQVYPLFDFFFDDHQPLTRSFQ
jgi:hypothetical protein